MVDLKRTAAEQNEGEACVGSEDNPYPWGMRLHLQKAEIDKLKIGLPAVDTEITFTAKAKVVGVTKRQESDGEDYETVELQICEMDVPNMSDDNDRADRMYGDS